MALTLYLVGALALLLGYWYMKIKKIYRYWEGKGLKTPTNTLLFGSSRPGIMNETMGEMHTRIYKAFPDESMVGYYALFQPALLIRDPALIESVVVKNFANFVDHGFDMDEETNPLEVSLFTMKGNRWRALRNKVSPVFTTGKLRAMTPSIIQAYEIAASAVKEEELKGFEIRNLFITYAIIVNGSCVFGIDTKEISKPNSEYREKSSDMFRMDLFRMIKLIILMSFPNFSKKLGLGFTPTHIIKYFQGMVVETMNQRKENPNLKRNDLVQTLMQLKDKGSLEFQSKDDPEDDYLINEDHQQTTEKFEMTDDLIVSQAMSFLSNGFEGVSIVMMYCCMELALNQEPQEKLRKEIDEKLNEKGGKLDYQAIKEMTYLDQCIQETLRLYPIAQSLMRVAVRKCKLGDVELDAGTQIFIPAMSIQRDPTYYPDPMKFDPDRFAPDKSRIPYTYLPFGEGPRICIGMRFALLEIKVGVLLAVRDFEMKLSPKTELPLKFSPAHFILTPKQKLFFDLTRRR